jgi:hypothetical protein
MGQVFVILLFLCKFRIIVTEDYPCCRLVVRHDMIHVMKDLGAKATINSTSREDVEGH